MNKSTQKLRESPLVAAGVSIYNGEFATMVREFIHRSAKPSKVVSAAKGVQQSQQALEEIII